MDRPRIGIDDMALYAPSPSMDLQKLLQQRSISHPDMEKKLRRAIENTGQRAFRFPEIWEDAASLAANAASALLDRYDGDYKDFRYFSVGSETAVDHAKPIASYVQGALQSTGYPLEHSMTTFEVKHACAGATVALLSIGALLAYCANPQEKGLVICSDISRYEVPSTAEITQGAGSVAMTVSRNPDLLELDMDQHGYYASDVDDFFRPIESVCAQVKGRYSMECYQKALVEALADYCRRRSVSTCELMDQMDYVVFHVPFVKMADTALRRLLNKTCGKDSQQIDDYIERTRFLEAMHLNRQLGNLYNGSLYAYLICLLKNEQERLGKAIAGRKILVASYGSGNTMIVFTAKVSPNASGRISAWKLKDIADQARNADFEEYLSWIARPSKIEEWRNHLNTKPRESGKYYLRGFSETGLRQYARS